MAPERLFHVPRSDRISAPGLKEKKASSGGGETPRGLDRKDVMNPKEERDSWLDSFFLTYSHEFQGAPMWVGSASKKERRGFR